MNNMQRVEACIPHAIAIETDAIFNPRLKRFSHRLGAMPDSTYFRYVTKEGKVNVAAGEAVLDRASVVRVTSADKYQRGYFEYYVAAILSKLLPDGYPNIFLGIAHPPDAIPLLDRIRDVLLGKHRIERHDGTLVTYNIRAIAPIDEPSGGLVRATTSQQSPRMDILEPTKIAIVDVGGKIGSITPAMLYPNGEIMGLFDDGDVFYLGVQDVEQNLQALLRDTRTDLFTREIPRSIIATAISKGGKNVPVFGSPEDFSEQFGIVVSPLVDAISNIYVSQLGGMRDVGRVYVTGGGGGLLFDTLKNEVFRQQVFPADVLSEIHLANVRGVVYAMEQYVEREAKRSLAKLFTSEYPPVIVAIDAGNSFGKGTVSHVYRR